ncbi:MAG: SDR family oxidoreductase, partial [Phototrophicaceae bacterium]
MEQPYSLANRSALITGASQGFGYAVAQAYLAAGADIAICARNAEKLEVARAELQASFPQRRIIAQPCDVADAAQVESLVQAAIDAFGQVQILVTNAGVYGPMGALDAVNWDEWVEA